ncbi:unnamed protein product [Schistocephalus solidus]|uniref:CHAT domain-containing protein n=1 Tax=Schistocephalus solidus TaxID=70667 RepID=A0A183TB13_SCHSO|nr:unnamed protein product [Schistocephalus solidus]
MKLILLREYFADFGVIFVKPVLVLTACASEDFEGGGLDYVQQLTPSCLHGGVTICSMQSEPHLGDDEAVICPTIGIADHLGHQHILSISPPNENIVQQQSAPSPRGLLPRRGAGGTVETQHFLPANLVCPNAGNEVTKDNPLIRFRYSRQEDVQVLVKCVLRRIRARHWGSVGTDDGGELFSPKRQAMANQAIIDNLQQAGQTSHDVFSDGTGKLSVALLCLLPAAPEEGVAGTHQFQLTLLRESYHNQTTIRAGQLSPTPLLSELIICLMCKLAQLLGNSSTRTTYTTWPLKHKRQDFTQQGVERSTSHMCELARGRVTMESSKPDSQTTGQPSHTTHIGLMRALSVIVSWQLSNPWR